MTTSTVQTNYDPLDLNSYSLNRLPKKKLTKTGAFFKKWGLPIAAILFFVLAYVVQIPILNQKQEIMFALFCNSSFSLDQRGAAELRYLNAFNLRPCADRNFKSETGNGNLGGSGYLVKRFSICSCKRFSEDTTC